MWSDDEVPDKNLNRQANTILEEHVYSIDSADQEHSVIPEIGFLYSNQYAPTEG